MKGEVFLLEENQFGYKKSYSTTDSIFSLFSFFEILKSKKKKLFCAFVDFEKAFDTVWRVTLWYKLLLNNINGKVCNAILNMYNDVKYCINYNNCKSAYFSCDMGVRQGEILPTFLFAFFLYDLQSFLEKENLPGLRDLPFNLKGVGGMVFCFVQNCFSDNTRVRIFIFLSR
jgi:hypothetical protein